MKIFIICLCIKVVFAVLLDMTISPLICGTDYRTYLSGKEFLIAQKHDRDLEIAAIGSCDTMCSEDNPVCGTDLNTYPNICYLGLAVVFDRTLGLNNRGVCKLPEVEIFKIVEEKPPLPYIKLKYADPFSIKIDKVMQIKNKSYVYLSDKNEDPDSNVKHNLGNFKPSTKEIILDVNSSNTRDIVEPNIKGIQDPDSLSVEIDNDPFVNGIEDLGSLNEEDNIGLNVKGIQDPDSLSIEKENNPNVKGIQDLDRLSVENKVELNVEDIQEPGSLIVKYTQPNIKNSTKNADDSKVEKQKVYPKRKLGIYGIDSKIKNKPDNENKLRVNLGFYKYGQINGTHIWGKLNNIPVVMSIGSLKKIVPEILYELIKQRVFLEKALPVIEEIPHMMPWIPSKIKWQKAWMYSIDAIKKRMENINERVKKLNKFETMIDAAYKSKPYARTNEQNKKEAKSASTEAPAPKDLLGTKTRSGDLLKNKIKQSIMKNLTKQYPML